jgi:hypothetical protein
VGTANTTLRNTTQQQQIPHLPPLPSLILIFAPLSAHLKHIEHRFLRYLGGLLGAFAVSEASFYLDRAHALGKLLLAGYVLSTSLHMTTAELTRAQHNEMQNLILTNKSKK